MLPRAEEAIIDDGTVRVTFQCSETLDKKLDARADKEHRSKSNLIRILLEQALAAEEESE